MQQIPFFLSLLLKAVFTYRKQKQLSKRLQVKKKWTSGTVLFFDKPSRHMTEDKLMLLTSSVCMGDHSDVIT